MTDEELMQQALEVLERCPALYKAPESATALRERLAQPQMQPCAGRNCGSTNPNLHSAECFEDYDKATGADSNRTWTQAHWTEYEHSIAAAERESCAKLCEQLSEDPMMSSGIDAIYCAEAIRARGQA